MMLLRHSPADIQKLLEKYEKDCAEIKKMALLMAWNMRGGVTYEDILNMSPQERSEIHKIIDHNMEITKKTQLPYF